MDMFKVLMEVMFKELMTETHGHGHWSSGYQKEGERGKGGRK